MHKWTNEDHELVATLTKEGWTVEEIANEFGYSVGSIKLSRKKSKTSTIDTLLSKINELEKRIQRLERQNTDETFSDSNNGTSLRSILAKRNM